jgi:histidyl-tRNA synthetase
LRRRGIATEVAPSAVKLGKQIRHAERRGIPYVWFPPSEAGAVTAAAHSVKDIRSGDQVDADPQSWTPPAVDLRPQLVGSHVEQAATSDIADIPAKEQSS